MSDFIEMLPQVIDNTIISTFRNCQTKGRFEFLNGLRPTQTSIHLHAGAAFAKAVETLYTEIYRNGASRGTALTKTEFAFVKAWGDFEYPFETNKTKFRVWDCVESYATQYDPPNDYIAPSPRFTNPFEYNFAIALDEAHFGIPFPLHPKTQEPFIYCGRFDMIGEHFGMLRIRDDKLVSSLGASWEKQYTLRSQFIGYVACMQILGYDLDTVEIRGVCPLTKTINHQTAVKTYAKPVVERWKHQLARDLHNVVAACMVEDFDVNFSDVCAQYGGCPFLDLCRANDPADYFASYTKRSWNPLEVERGAPQK